MRVERVDAQCLNEVVVDERHARALLADNGLHAYEDLGPEKGVMIFADVPVQHVNGSQYNALKHKPAFRMSNDGFGTIGAVDILGEDVFVFVQAPDGVYVVRTRVDELKGYAQRGPIELSSAEVPEQYRRTGGAEQRPTMPDLSGIETLTDDHAFFSGTLH